jgi:PAS domain S-box-containing protein
MNGFSRWSMAMVVVALLVLLASGAWFYGAQEHRFRQETETQLAAVAQLKVGQIAAWRQERLVDAAVLMQGRFFVEAAAQWMAAPQAHSADQLLTRFRSLQQHCHYRDVLLVDAQGKVRLSLGGSRGPIHKDEAVALAEGLRDRRPLLTELHAGPSDLPPHVDAIAPLFVAKGNSGEPVGAIILQCDAKEFLYPLVQSWPTPSRTAETLLVRRDGDAVLFLNELRHQAGTALTLRIPLSRDDVPEVMAVKGWEGVVQGCDYRGVQVLSAMTAVPDSPWFMVAKVDAAEVLAGWRLQSALILVLILAALALAAVAVFAAWQSNAKAHWRTLFEAEAARRRAEARYRVTLMSVGDGVITTDAEGRIELLNSAAETLTGWTSEEARSHPLEEVFRIVNETTRADVENPVARVLREGTVVGLANHTVLIARDGTERLIGDSGAPVRGEDGDIFGVVLVFRDQTEQRAAEEALRLRDRAIDASTEGICITGPNEAGNPLVYVNQGFELLTGYSAEDVLGRNMRFLQGADTDQAAVQWIRAAIKSEQAFTAEILNYRKDGTPFWNQFSVTPVKDATGKAAHFVAVLHDITERKRAEESLRESEARHRTLVENIPQKIFVKDRNLRWLSVNERLARDLGLRPEDVQGREDSDFFPKDLADKYRADDRRIMESGVTDEFDEEYLERGERRFVHTIKTPVRDAAGAIIGILGVFSDITDRKADEDRLAALELRLTHASRLAAMGELAAGIAHEVNQPLCAIVNFAKACKNTASGEAPDLLQICEWSDAIATAAARSGDIIRGMLGLARGHGSTRETVAVGQLVIDAMRLLRHEAETRNVALRQEMPDEGLAVCVDPVRIHQVLVNLLRNAVEAFADTRPADRQVAVRARLVDGLAQVSVSDNGLGQPEAELPRIFEPFFTTKPQGLGMGLAISKTIIEDHGGRISATANQGGGLTIHFTLPAEKEKPQDAPEPDGVRGG